MLIHTGHTVHIVPGERGAWNVVDLQRHGQILPNKAEAVQRAKCVAQAHQPSQVVLIEPTGEIKHIASYQLPTYQYLQSEAPKGSSLIEACVKAALIGGMVAAGIGVLQDLVDRVEREAGAKPKRAASKHSRRRRTA